MDKQLTYKFIELELLSLLEKENDYIASLANCTALLYEKLEQVNWVGFYIIKNNELVLGPFQGKVASTRITIGKGVCGTCVKEGKTKLINDVHKFKGHIACDSSSNSEIVIPIFKNNEVIAVLDIDSPILNKFNQDDQFHLEKVSKILENSRIFI
ncbi:MAG: GAF domain-containing protein [Clostridiales bacterium]|nr:GAF domain-containing protein [Clostridiales bacterium]